MDYHFYDENKHPAALMIELHFELPTFLRSYLEDGLYWEDKVQSFSHHPCDYWTRLTDEEKEVIIQENISILLDDYVRITHEKIGQREEEIAQREEEQRIIDEENLPILK